MFKRFVPLAAFVLLWASLACAPVGTRVSSTTAGTPVASPTDVAALPAPATTKAAPSAKSAGQPVAVTSLNPSTCTYRIGFIADVTIPDGTVIAPGASFTKTWRVRNDGTCTWGYAGSALHRLVFVGGDPLGAPSSFELPFPELGQGGTADISVPMVAPVNPGTYQSNWRLQVDNGVQVGVGPNGTAPLYARIVVTGPATPTPVPPPADWKTYISSQHSYTINYPASWTISVQNLASPSGKQNTEGVYLGPPQAMWAPVQIYVLKGAPPIAGYDQCDKNLIFRGLPACSISLPDAGPVPQKLLIFQKGETYFHLEARYTTQEQIAVFEEIVKSFQFTE